MQEFKMPVRKQESHKGTFGKVLNVCGSENYIGASYLSTVSSLKVGAGYSALASTRDVIRSVSSLLPEAVFLLREDCLKKLNNYSVILIGCGLGLNKVSERFFRRIMCQLQKETDMPIIIDADGLTLLSKLKNVQKLFNSHTVVLTPHLLEATRLLNCSLEEVLMDLEYAAKQISKKYNCITVLKSHRTVICNSDLSLYINKHGNSALAKAGSGDVLAGMIAGLIAQRMDVYEACKLGVYLHSRTGEIASEELTEYSVLASDLLKYIHKSIKELEV